MLIRAIALSIALVIGVGVVLPLATAVNRNHPRFFLSTSSATKQYSTPSTVNMKVHGSPPTPASGALRSVGSSDDLKKRGTPASVDKPSFIGVAEGGGSAARVFLWTNCIV